MPSDESAQPGSNDAADTSAESLTRTRLSESTHARLKVLRQRFHLDSLDAAVVMLLDLYEASNGSGAPCELRDLNAGVDRFGTVLMALAATNVSIANTLRKVESGQYAKLEALSRALTTELARVRSIQR